MTIAFHANAVAIEEMNECWLVAFADEKFDTRHYLMLERSYEDDEQDVKLGMNTYHVERDDQLWSCYGGIERFELYKDRVVIRFSRSGVEQLKVDGMEITFTVDGPLFDTLTRGLERIFTGSECLAIQV